jgi:hypothetical protein
MQQRKPRLGACDWRCLRSRLGKTSRIVGGSCTYWDLKWLLDGGIAGGLLQHPALACPEHCKRHKKGLPDHDLAWFLSSVSFILHNHSYNRALLPSPALSVPRQ